MTKVSVFGQTEKKEKELKPIELIKWIDSNGMLVHSGCRNEEWQNIVLLSRRDMLDLDVIWCYDENPNTGTIYLGHWNDGVV